MLQRILIHVCCGVCGAYVVEQLKPQFDALRLFSYNPNIYPPEEYHRRMETVRELSRIYGVPFEEGEFEPEVWNAAVRGFEDEPERGRRCKICFRLRLDKTAVKAKEIGFSHFTTTLSMGRSKRSRDVIEIGREVAAARGVEFLAVDFKKQGGIDRTLALAKQYNFYRQTYCGCKYSMRPETVET